MAIILRALKSRWFLLLAVGIASLGLNHYLKDSHYLSNQNIIQKITSWYCSTSGRYVQVAKISHRAEKRGGDWYATIYVTVENISQKTVTALSGNLKYTAGKPQTATLQYSGKIPPGGQEKIAVYVHLPRSGGLFGRFKVKFTKVEVQKAEHS